MLPLGVAQGNNMESHSHYPEWPPSDPYQPLSCDETAHAGYWCAFPLGGTVGYEEDSMAEVPQFSETDVRIYPPPFIQIQTQTGRRSDTMHSSCSTKCDVRHEQDNKEADG